MWLSTEVLVLLGGLLGDSSVRALDEREPNARVNILLEHFGGHDPRQRHVYVEVTRPGKQHSASATVAAIGAGGTRCSWSTHWENLSAGAYSLSAPEKRVGIPGYRFSIPSVDEHEHRGRVAPTLACSFSPGAALSTTGSCRNS